MNHNCISHFIASASDTFKDQAANTTMSIALADGNHEISILLGSETSIKYHVVGGDEGYVELGEFTRFCIVALYIMRAHDLYFATGKL